MIESQNNPSKSQKQLLSRMICDSTLGIVLVFLSLRIRAWAPRERWTPVRAETARARQRAGQGRRAAT